MELTYPVGADDLLEPQKNLWWLFRIAIDEKYKKEENSSIKNCREKGE